MKGSKRDERYVIHRIQKLRSILPLDQTNISKIRKILFEIRDRISWHEPSLNQINKMIEMTWRINDTYNFKRKTMPEEIDKLKKILPFNRQVSLHLFLEKEEE